MAVYMDHAATTPTDPRVVEKMLPFFTDISGNASSIHCSGRAAAKAIAEARQALASAIGASPEEIYFTSGGTESDNWALRGTAAVKGSGHIITSVVEHHAILDCCRFLEKQGFEVTYLPVEADGRILPERLRNAIRQDTCLVSIMYANNETGAVMPVKELATIASEYGVPFHTDAVQAVGHLPIDVKKSGISMLSMSAHKFYGPKGVGALYIKEGLAPEKFMLGGGQEKGRRAGTHNTPGIVGMGEAIRLSVEEMSERAGQEKVLTTLLRNKLCALPDVRQNGSFENRLPGHLNMLFEGKSSKALAIFLDRKGIAVSLGSACSSQSSEASYVLQAMGLTPQQAMASIRFSLGWRNTEEEVLRTVQVVNEFYSL